MMARIFKFSLVYCLSFEFFPRHRLKYFLTHLHPRRIEYGAKQYLSAG